MKKKQFDFKFSKQARKILDVLDSYILNEYGERCKTCGQCCPICQMWALRDLLATNLY